MKVILTIVLTQCFETTAIRTKVTGSTVVIFHSQTLTLSISLVSHKCIREPRLLL